MAAFESLSQNRSPAVQQRSNAVQENVFEQQAVKPAATNNYFLIATRYEVLRFAQNDKNTYLNATWD
jgi:hypothetical protein